MPQNNDAKRSEALWEQRQKLRIFLGMPPEDLIKEKYLISFLKKRSEFFTLGKWGMAMAAKSSITCRSIKVY